ncbi:hypothetical protein COLO4_23863 [Corchorus olitorius]|uniref:Uncharacterized protein n=1 Tax=Corchorus olitorius TaxID=93759 RepID=A0A1R3IEA7_9ROSI|nr:hypothetical protein COLO4_23863 [Corchorus olitorius]
MGIGGQKWLKCQRCYTMSVGAENAISVTSLVSGAKNG